MPEALNTVVIDRPIDEVFAFLANAENDRQWRSGIIEISLISGEGVGARYHQVVAGPGGRRINADIEITEFVPHELIGFKTLSGPVRPTGAYRFDASGSSTRVTFELQVQLTGIKRMVMGGMVQKTMTGEVAALSELKRVLEAAGA